MTDALLSIRDLKTHFRSRPGPVRAVDGVTLDVRKGETVAIVGESGSGKSVLGLSILRLIAPPGFHAGGEILFEGEQLTRARERDLRGIRGNRIAMIFQDPATSLNPYLTVERQMTEVLEVHRHAARASARRRSIEMLERMGIPDAATRIRDYPHRFSGGMRQRVMIAMALLCGPELLIADEPTTALDVTTQAEILALLRELRSEMELSILLISHDLGVVAGLADRVAVMYAGRIVEVAGAEVLFRRPKHPYTGGLLACRPRRTGISRSPVTPIPGQPPDLAALPPGCPFAPRCDRVSEKCRAEYPKPVAFGDDWAACWEARA